MKLYIAGASAEIERCEAFRDAAVALGYEITGDWCTMIRSVGNANVWITVEQRRAAEDLATSGVAACELFVLLMPRTLRNGSWEYGHTIGAWCELAMAKRGEKEILLVGERPERTVFTVDLECIATDAEALMWMRGRLANGG